MAALAMPRVLLQSERPVVLLALVAVFLTCLAIVYDELSKTVLAHQSFFIRREISARIERKNDFAAEHAARTLRALKL
ncbi:hypothetical protein [Bradyrhizobium sp. USDA 329]|uniref:hypothetical protein n=1 Tax=unclassified Bradyrhizobium TaxID=2631580 RepID=UPI003517FD82